MYADKRVRFHLDLLAEAERGGWVDWHLDNGWTQSATRNDVGQEGSLFIPYSDLPEKERLKDQDAIRSYPEIARLAGMKIVPCA